jgi:hypothetical protein
MQCDLRQSYRLNPASIDNLKWIPELSRDCLVVGDSEKAQS